MELLQLFPRRFYTGIHGDDPLRFYYLPFIGALFRRRVELALGECRGGESVLEVGFGSGLTFLNLHHKYRHIFGLDLNSRVEEIEGLFRGEGLDTTLRKGDLLDMPWDDGTFDTILAISVLEHLRPPELERAFAEFGRVLKASGQLVYGVPVERPFMVWMFRLLGYDIRDHHFSTENDIYATACRTMEPVRRIGMSASLPFLGRIYEVGHFTKSAK